MRYEEAGKKIKALTKEIAGLRSELAKAREAAHAFHLLPPRMSEPC